MATATAAKPRDVTKMKPRDLAEELVLLHRQHQAAFDRADELKSALRTDAKENFKETFVGIGEVLVSAPKPARVEGEAPELDVALFLALKKAERNVLLKSGLVRMAEIKVAAYHGRVTVKTF